MKRYGWIFAVAALLLGLGLFATAVFLRPEYAGTAGNSTMIGVGLGLFGGSMGYLVPVLVQRTMTPEQVRQQEILEGDERSRTIRERAGYTAWYFTLLATAALSFVMLAIHDYTACFFVLGLLVLESVGYFAALYYYNKAL